MIPKLFVFADELQAQKDVQFKNNMLNFFRNAIKMNCIPTPDEISQMMGISRDDFERIYQDLIGKGEIELVNGCLAVREGKDKLKCL